MSGGSGILARAFGARPRLGIFAGALALRWANALILFAWMGEEGVKGPDSSPFLAVMRDFAAAVADGKVTGWQWLGPTTGLMPLFMWLLTLHALVAAPFDALTYVLMQGLFDAGTCVIVLEIARRFDPRMALPAAIAAALTPTAIVMSGLVYTDTIFVFFAAVSLLGVVHWLKAPSWWGAGLIGAGLGAAALMRAFIVGWSGALVVLLVAALLIRRRARLAHFAQIVAAIAIFSALFAPVLVRNFTQYRSFSPTAQTGPHWALWIVPLVKEAADGTPWSVTAKEMENRMRARHPTPHPNPFVESERFAAIAIEAMRELGPVEIAKAWLYGAAINLASPAALISPPISTLPRTGFYDTPGNSKFEKILNFLFRSENALFAWIVLLGALGLLAWRIAQLVGVFALLRRRDALLPMLILVAWSGFILAISGPIASPKYRLPIEPVLSVLAGAGYAAMARRRRVGGGGDGFAASRVHGAKDSRT